MREPTERGAQPSFPLIRRLDRAWFRAEQLLCGVMFLAMGLLVFASVIRDVFGTDRGWGDVAGLFAFVWLALETRVVRDGEHRRSRAANAAIAAALTAAIAGVIEIYLRNLPGGFVWAGEAALGLMLWVAFLGASMATYEKAHLSLEFGEKIWPRGVLHVVKAIAHAITSACCLALLALSIHSIREHYAAWKSAGGHGSTLQTLDWVPLWAVYLVFPYVFAAMAVRLLAQTYTIATRTDEAPKEQVPT
ncbi:MAG: TRAP transporter small permease [Deltaproteobacteria bacterium]|nr:MAG: TRAP transporter small permease [Deltaproteobacteria bacterium]